MIKYSFEHVVLFIFKYDISMYSNVAYIKAKNNTPYTYIISYNINVFFLLFK